MVEHLGIALSENWLKLSALFGCFFPAFAMIFGAWLGLLSDGSDGATALGAIAGFLGALTIARIVIGLIPLPIQSHVSQQEFHHERHSNY